MRRTILIGVAGVLGVVAVATLTVFLADRPTILRVAVTRDSEDYRLMQAATQTFARDRENIRFKLIAVDDPNAAAKALDAKQADLGVIRTDMTLPQIGQTVIILHRNAAVLIAPSGSPLKNVGDLTGRRIGLITNRPGANGNRKLMETILAQYDVPITSITMIVTPLGDVPKLLAEKQVDLLLAVGVTSAGIIPEAVSLVTQAGGGAPVFIPVKEASAIAQRSLAFESAEIVRGAFGGTPPKPASSFETLGINVRLMARTDIRDDVVSDVIRLMFAERRSIAELSPLANRIEAPSTEKGAALPVHTGAAAFLDGEEQTFFDKYSDIIYIGAMFVSLAGSGIAAFASRMSARSHEEIERLLERLLEILKSARLAADTAALDVLENETDEIIASALTGGAIHSLDGQRVPALGLALDQVRAAIRDRRKQVDGVKSVIPFRPSLAGE